MKDDRTDWTLELETTPLLDDAPSSQHVQAQLVVLRGQFPGTRFVVENTLLLGRGNADESTADLVDEGVSRRHATITKTLSGYVIQDLGSRNGTYVDGRRISQAPLAFGSKVSLGSSTQLLFASRDRFEEQRARAQRLQALGELSGGIAHDFNNLLGVVLANTTYLQSCNLDGSDPSVPVQEVLADIATAGNRAVELTKQLLSFARSTPLSSAPVCLHTVGDELERLLRRNLPAAIRLEVEIPTDVFVMGDSSQLLQVLMNLCINARDSMEHGGLIAVRASVEAAQGPASPRSTISLTVSDEGPGISDSIKARIFEPFFTTKERGQGTGLGLATVKSIVEDHGGTIDVTTALGEGTTFDVRLPATENRPERGRIRSTTSRGMTPPAPVLIVEDEALVRVAARRILQSRGYEVLEAENGREAVRAIEHDTNRLGAVILDLDMPGMDGESVLRRVRALSPTLPVLITSGHIDAERERSLRDANVSGILWKPYSTDQVLTALSDAMRPPES